MATFEAKGQKVKGVADIIFLLDATGSMDSCINDVKENVAKFLESLKNPSNPNEQAPIRDWRAAVYAYRDYAADGADNWFVANPFTRDPAEVRRQLAGLVATGGGDEPEDLLDALYKIANIGETPKNGSENEMQWRYHSQAARCVVVFTDATFHGCTSDGMSFCDQLPSAPGCTGEDVKNHVEMNKLRVSIYAPEFDAFGWNGYETLSSQIDKLEYEAIPFGDDNNPQRALAAFTGNSANFKKTLSQLAKSVSASAEAATLDEVETLPGEGGELGGVMSADGGSSDPAGTGMDYDFSYDGDAPTES